MADTVLVAFDGSWKKLQGARYHSPGFEAPAFDDSGWASADGPFGSGSECSYVYTTAWTVNTDLCLRKAITVEAGTAQIVITFGVDNDAEVYWDGTLIRSVAHEGCAARNNFSITIASPTKGAHVLAVRAIDRGSVTFFSMKAVASVSPQPGVYADWGADGFGDTDSIDYLTSDVLAMRISRGASPEITGGAQPGSATIVLNNSVDDRYNPRNTGGPLYGKLVDGVAIWAGLNSDGAATGTDPRGLFGGRITDISVLPEPGATYAPKVEIICEDALGWYGRTPVRLAYAEGRAHDAFRAALLTAAGETRTSLAGEIETMPLSAADGSLLGVLEQVNQANGTRHFAKPSDSASDWYAYTTRGRQWRLNATVDGTLSAASDHVTGTSGWRLSADTVTNRQQATVTPVSFTAGAAVAWEADVLPLEVTATRPLEMWVELDDYVSDATLNLASTGAALTSALTALGDTAKISLSVASGTATITALSIIGRLARRAPNESHVADNAASQALARGVREGSAIGNEYVGSLASARGIAEHVVWRYGDPQLRPTLTVENWLPYQLELDLYDVIAFSSPQLGVTALLFEIVGLTHDVNVAASATVHHIVTTYVLQECKVQTDPGWFVLNTSLLNSTAKLAY